MRCDSAIQEELKSREAQTVAHLFPEGFQLLQWLRLKDDTPLHEAKMVAGGNADELTETSVPSAAYLASAPVSVGVSFTAQDHVCS